MKKFNKKGFTLIELMAVVIILIIIIFLAITKINKTSKNARDNAIIANAGSYIKAVNSYLSVEGVNNEELDTFEFGLYDIIDKVKVTGTKPNYGTFSAENYEVKEACLIYDGFKITYKNGKLSNPKKGNCPIIYVYEYAYTGHAETFVVPYTAKYKIQLWGAGGGKGNATFGGANLDNAGYGGYTSGIIELTAGETLYVYVGQKGNQAILGSSSTSGASFNGGGSGAGASDNDDAGGSGGGATDVRLVNGNWNDLESLASRIMVAGGGAGAPVIGKAASHHGGHAGGLTGTGEIYRWENSLVTNSGLHATQTSGYMFGIGQDAILGIGCAGSGAGGGYWGGKTQQVTNVCGSHGGGGSSYISGYTGCVAITSQTDTTPKAGCADGTTDKNCSIHYSNKVFTKGVMKAGNQSIPTFDGSDTMTGNSENGYAKIELIY